MSVVHWCTAIHSASWHVRAHFLATTQNCTQNFNHHVQSIAFVTSCFFKASQRSQAASQEHFFWTSGAANSCVVNAPSMRNLLALAMADFNLSYWHSGCSHIKLKAISVFSWAVACYRISSSCALTSSGWNHKRACVGESKTNEVFLQRQFWPIASDAKVVTIVAHHEANTCGFGLLNA